MSVPQVSSDKTACIRKGHLRDSQVAKRDGTPLTRPTLWST